MPLDKQDKEAIRAVVASELQDILRGEMAQWWAESVLALSRAQGGQQEQAGSDQASSRFQGGQATRSPAGTAGGDGGPDVAYLTQVVESLTRAQGVMARDLELSMKRIRAILEEMDSMVDELVSQLAGS